MSYRPLAAISKDTRHTVAGEDAATRPVRHDGPRQALDRLVVTGERVLRSNTSTRAILLATDLWGESAFTRGRDARCAGRGATLRGGADVVHTREFGALEEFLGAVSWNDA